MTSRPLALIVDDEEDLRTLSKMALLKLGVDTVLAATVNEAYTALATHRFQFCLTDMNLPDGSGLDIVQHIHTHFEDIPVAVITAYGSIDTAIKALKMGAFDFVNKPLEISKLKQLVLQALKVQTTANAKDTTPAQVAERTLLGQCAAIVALRHKLEKLAKSQAPIHIKGESGTGKEVAARLLHQLGPRATAPFVAVNCGAIPTELMESEFFGHKKGSFTGANEDKIGLFESARGGTLFLDEVADLPLTMQVKLLRAIQEKKIRPIGEHQEIAVDVRIVSATHKDLLKLTEQGLFRPDLYYRINVIEIELPPLRARGQDILLLAEHLLEHIAHAWHCDTPKLTAASANILLNYRFPGNVRELHNILERAMSLTDGQTIEPEHMQLQVLSSRELNDNTLLPSAPSTFTEIPPEGMETYLENIEKGLLLNALQQCNGNKTAAAKKLGISFRTLRYKLKKLGLDNTGDEADL